MTIFRDNYEDARFIFSRLFTDLKNQFEDMGSTLTELDANERLRIFHDFYRGNDKDFNLDFDDLSKKGYSFKDTITPSNPKFKNKYFKFDEKYGRVLYLKDFPNNLSDTFIGDLCDFNKNMVYSFDLMLLPPDEGRKEIENKLDGVEKNITIQDGNLDGITNTFAVAKSDRETITYEINTFIQINGGVVYAVPK